jgi:hypothetical protein
MMGLRRLATARAAIWLGSAPAIADGVERAAEVAALGERLAALEERVQSLEAARVKASAATARTQAALERDLAQPMLLLVGMGPCPHGFKRIATRVLILTRARTSENGHLFDEAGLTYEDPPGVGDNVYRDLDVCFRPANAVGLE